MELVPWRNGGTWEGAVPGGRFVFKSVWKQATSNAICLNPHDFQGKIEAAYMILGQGAFLGIKIGEMLLRVPRQVVEGAQKI